MLINIIIIIIIKYVNSHSSGLVNNSWKLNLDYQKNIPTEWTDIAGDTITLKLGCDEDPDEMTSEDLDDVNLRGKGQDPRPGESLVWEGCEGVYVVEGWTNHS